MTSYQRKNQHLLWRAGFGPAATEWQQVSSVSPQQLFRNLQEASAAKPHFLDAADSDLKTVYNGLQEDGMRKLIDPEVRRAFQQQARQGVRDLNLLWLDEMVQSKAQLREKMAFFWHGHFASRSLNVFYQQQLLDVIRQYALGSFRDLLHGVSKSAAILNFLNAQQNRKGHPNENFAREVMELFTLGRGHYTETDIKEAAKAFTGWGANLRGDFVFRRFQHDDGTKTVLGKTGTFKGEDVLDILLEKKQTASYITQKIYRFLVNEEVDGAKADWLSQRFYQSGYNIGKLLEDIFTSDWFYEEKNTGQRIKSPVELLVGIRRQLPMDIENKDVQLLVQRLLGQVLFYPPNVAGWPGGKAWIDSSTLMFRMRLPQLISENDELNIRPKSDDDQMMGRIDDNNTTMVSSKKAAGRLGRPIKATVEWGAYTKQFEPVKREALLEAIKEVVLQVKPSYPLSLIGQYADSSSRDAFVKTATLQLMSTPEYQLC